jgi:hypothetical protein
VQSVLWRNSNLHPNSNSSKSPKQPPNSGPGHIKTVFNFAHLCSAWLLPKWAILQRGN